MLVSRFFRVASAAGLCLAVSCGLVPLALGTNTGGAEPDDPSTSGINQPDSTPNPSPKPDNMGSAKTFEKSANFLKSSNYDEVRARASFEAVWSLANKVVPFSTGTIISSCKPGSPTPEATSQMMSIWNYMRSLNGLDPVSISADSSAAAPAQEAALTAAIGPVAVSSPASTKNASCVTPGAQLASGAGVIARLDGIVTPATEILRYITEASTSNSNDNLGHRLEMFAPQQARTAIGAVSIGTSGPSASSIQLFDSVYQSAGKPLFPPLWNNNAAAPQQITWPSPGFFPTRLLPTGANESISRWSYSARCADLRNSRVDVTGADGTSIPVEVIRRSEPGIDPNLTPWDYAGYDTVLFKVPLSYLRIPQFYDKAEYEVRVSGIQPAAGCTNVPEAASYTVKLFNSTWPADPYGDADNDGTPNFRDSKPLIPNLRATRLSGADRVGTAVRIALEMPTKPEKVYLARSDILVDALVGGALKDGPVLLMPPEGTPVPPIVSSVIRAINPSEVTALGGTSAVSDQRLFEIAAGRKATRIGGRNRIETSILVARRANVQANSLYLAQAYGSGGEASPDALTGATLPDGPIVLVDSAAPTVATIQRLAADLQVKRVVALGGSGVVPGQLLRDIAAGRSATRIAGSDRYATSLQIALESFRLHPTNRAYLARGDIFADAVAGTKLQDGPIVLLPPGCKPLSKDVLKTFSALQAFQITALGGSQAVCEQNLQETLHWPDIVNETVTEF